MIMKKLQSNKRMRSGYMSAAVSTFLIGVLIWFVIWTTLKVKSLFS